MQPRLTMLFLAACEAPLPEAEHDIPLDQAFQQAAVEFDVPKDLLVALSYSMTRFDEPDAGDHEHAGMRGYGVMDLGAGSPATGPDLARGAERIGVDIDRARYDRAANIRVAASEMRDEADRIEVDEGITIERIDDWVGVVGWYSGSEDGGAQRSFARQVYTLIEGGLRAENPDGGFITIAGRELDLPMLDMVPVMASGGDSSLTDNVVAAASCNYSAGSRGSSSIDMIVVHTAQGSYSGTYNWFQNCSAQASAHYVIRSSDGEITQMVGEEDTAWHAGDSSTNSRSVSIELEGYIEDPARWFTDASYQSTADLIKEVAGRQGISLDRTHIIGHMEVPGCSYSGGGGRNCHTDPGTGYDWNKLMSLVGGSSSSSSSSTTPPTSSTGNLVGFVRKDSIYNSGNPVAGASVKVSSGQSATTDSRGYFSMSGVPAGSQTVTVSAGGYATATDPADITAGITNWNSVAVVASSGSSTSTVPTGASPTGWTTVKGSSVTMTWSAISGATYEVKIYWYDGSDWNDYYGYSTSTASKTFWPYVKDTYYAFVVRSVSGGVASEWTSMNYFYYDG